MELIDYEQTLTKLMNSYDRLINTDISVSFIDYVNALHCFQKTGIDFTYKCEDLRQLLISISNNINKDDIDSIIALDRVLNLSKRYDYALNLIKQLI